MKKYLSLLIVLALTGGAFAQIDRPERRRPPVDAIIERIQAALEGDLSERRRAFLEHRLAYLELHKDIRAAFREAMADLGEDATREQRNEAAKAVREQFSDQLQDIKEARREAAKKRRHLRRAADADDDSDG